METKTRNKIIVLFFSQVVVMLGFGMIMPLIPFYMDKFGAGGSELGLLISSYGLAQFIFAPVWGALSDRWGRKIVMIVGILGNGITLLAFGLASSLLTLFIARILSGILASAMLPTAIAYIGDITTEEERGRGVGFVGAAAGVGLVIGPGIGGLLAYDSITLPFFIASLLSLISLLLVIILLPESLEKEKRLKKEQVVRKIRYKAMKEALFSTVGTLLVITFIVSIGLTNFQGIFGLYALEKFGYGPQKVGTILMIMGIVLAVGQGVIAGILTRKFGDGLVIKASLLLGSGGFISMILVESYLGVLMSTGFFMLSISFLRTSIVTLISKKSTIGQGVVMGLNDSFKSLGRIIGPVWAGVIFDINLNFPYIVGAVVMLIGFIIGMFKIESNDKRIKRLN